MPSIEPEDLNHSLRIILKTAESKRWSGIFKIFVTTEQIGVVIVYDGSVAWATSTKQTENFASFLEKIGLITKERQKEILDQYKILGKTKELGKLLEETGLISHTTFRTCLRKQIQAALDSFFRAEGLMVNPVECEINVNRDLMFRLNEVLSDSIQSVQPEIVTAFEPAETANTDNLKESIGLGEILKNLSSLSGYQYSFICDMEEKILASHKSDTFSENVEEIISSSAPYIISTSTTSNYSNMGKIEFVLLEYDKGSIVAQWPDFERDFFIAASFDKNGKPGVIKHKFSEMIPAIRGITGVSH